jgi:glycosyltransferase involved in cell wall biosynthesis
MEVIRGGAEFFGVTKAMHNVLHGTPVEITKPMLELFQEVNVENAASLDLDADLVVIHDPQPVALVTGRANGQGHWVRRCHVDVSRPQPDVWAFLRQYVVQYDASVFSAPEFSQRLPITQYMIHPAIDPLAEKNRGMAPGEVEEIRTRLGIRDDRPFVTEALWKKRPVIASAVGGTPLQVGHNLTGLLVHSIEGTAHRIRSLLRDPEFARRLGENGHEYVMTRFLTTSNLRGWLALAISLMHPGERIIHLG